MKSILYLVLSSFLFLGCYKEEPENDAAIMGSSWNIANFKCEYAIPEKGILLGRNNNVKSIYDLKTKALTPSNYCNLENGYAINLNNDIVTVDFYNANRISIIKVLDSSVINSFKAAKTIKHTKIASNYIASFESEFAANRIYI
jgi:hypothetical protein